jgi:hypothetical protein
LSVRGDAAAGDGVDHGEEARAALVAIQARHADRLGPSSAPRCRPTGGSWRIRH